MSPVSIGSVRRVEPLAIDWQHASWEGACFDTARRRYTPLVEGTIWTPQHIVFATLEGSADSLTVRSSCGHRFHGVERTGAVSIVPAYCERELRMRGVEARWASLAIDASAFESEARGARLDHCVSNVRDDFLFGVLQEMTRLWQQDANLDPLYCETMTHAVVQYLARRHGGRRKETSFYRLTRWQMTRLESYVEAHLASGIRIADLATLAGCSLSHFHRAFRLTNHVTPLEYINHRRVQRAQRLLRTTPTLSIAAVAGLVGFASANHFTRTVGVTPIRYRARS